MKLSSQSIRIDGGASACSIPAEIPPYRRFGRDGQELRWARNSTRVFYHRRLRNGTLYSVTKMFTSPNSRMTALYGEWSCASRYIPFPGQGLTMLMPRTRTNNRNESKKYQKWLSCRFDLPDGRFLSRTRSEDSATGQQCSTAR